MSREFLDEFFPDRDNDPSNYALIRGPISDTSGYYVLCYKPEMDNTALLLELKEDLDKLFQVFEYLLANGVEIIEFEDFLKIAEETLLTESSNPLEEFKDSNPENYFLIRSAHSSRLRVGYEPTDAIVEFIDCHDLELRVIDYLLAQGVRIEEDIENLPND